MLNKRERNKIYQIIVARKFEPAEFDFEDTDDRVTISHESGSTFEFIAEEEADLDLSTLFEEPSDPPPEPRTRIYYRFTALVTEGISKTGTATSVDTVTNVYVPDWLKEIRETVGVPDYWEEMRRNRESIAAIQHGDSGNTSFTQAEQRQIASQLQGITEQLKRQYELTSEQAERIDEWRDEVVEASTRMQRKDWFIYVLGTVTALTIAAAVPSGMGEHILTVVVHGLGYLFTGGSEPPQFLT